MSEVTAPQRSCSYNDGETVRKQSRVIYGRDASYKKPFGASDIMQSVSGLGKFAEYDLDGGQVSGAMDILPLAPSFLTSPYPQHSLSVC